MASLWRFGFGIVLTCACAGSGPSAASRVEQIEKELPTLRVDSGTVFDFSTEGASIIAHYREHALRCLHAKLLGETGKAEETYYFDPHLILLRRAASRYDAPLRGFVRDSTTAEYWLAGDTTDVRLRDSLTVNAHQLLAALHREQRSMPDARP